MDVSIVIPCYNNKGSLSELLERVCEVSKHDIFTNHSVNLVFVDDGSTDGTFQELRNLLHSHSEVPAVLVKLTRNFGSYNSFLAGIANAEGDCCVYLHADLQDPPELIPKMFSHFLKGNSLVIANRESRDDANIFSTIYHSLVRKYALKNAPLGGFDLVMFNQRIRNDLVQLSEKNTNNVYLINWLAYPYVNIPYKRGKRRFGKSQWGFWKKVKLFVDTFFSFTLLPLRAIRWGFTLSMLLFFISAILLIFNAESLRLLVLTASFGLLSFVSFNFIILSEYINRIHETVRNRPNYVVEDIMKYN